jgi:hypothetical protein
MKGRGFRGRDLFTLWIHHCSTEGISTAIQIGELELGGGAHGLEALWPIDKEHQSMAEIDL